MLTSMNVLLRAGAAGQEIIVPGEFSHLRGYLVGYDDTSITLLACMKAPAAEGEEPQLLWNVVLVPRNQTLIFTTGRLENEPKSVRSVHETLAGRMFVIDCKNKLASQLSN